MSSPFVTNTRKGDRDATARGHVHRHKTCSLGAAASSSHLKRDYGSFPTITSASRGSSTASRVGMAVRGSV